jgi:hypothetical protein
VRVKIAQFNKGSPMKSSRLGTCLLLAFSIVAASYAEAAATCVDVASPSTLVFEGILRHKIFAGPPEFEDVRKGDTPEPTYILELDEPACARNDEFIDPGTRFKTIHLTYDQTTSEGERLKEQLRQLTGQHVVVKGKSGEGAGFCRKFSQWPRKAWDMSWFTPPAQRIAALDAIYLSCAFGPCGSCA